MANGSYSYILVCKGFSHGVIVLKEIILQVEHNLCKRAECWKLSNQPLDETISGVPIIMAYVNVVNALMPPDDTKSFLGEFQLYGAPLGAIMDTEK